MPCKAFTRCHAGDAVVLSSKIGTLSGVLLLHAALNSLCLKSVELFVELYLIEVLQLTFAQKFIEIFIARKHLAAGLWTAGGQ